MVKTLLKISTGLALVAGIAATPASAVTILTFGQTNPTGGIVATTPTAGSTQLTSSNVSVLVTYIENSSFQPATFNFSALSSGVATAASDGIRQNFTGTFSVLGAGNVNLLSGSFTNLAMFWGSAMSTAQFDAGAAAFSYSSSVITSLSAPVGFSLSLSGVTPALHIENGTIAPFSSSVSGTFDGTSAVPEPASWALMVGGFGMLGATMRRRRPTVTARFG